MKAGLEYYSEMFRGAQGATSRTCTSRRSPRSRSRTSRASRRCPCDDVLIALREAGLDTMPGGGAEVFSPRRARDDRRQEARRREDGSTCIATRTGSASASNCTMLYGHVETIEDRIEHLGCCATCRTRPAASSPTSRSRITPTTTSSASSSDAQGTATTGFDDLRNLAVGRLFLDNFEHIKTHWIMVTPFAVADRRCTSA